MEEPIDLDTSDKVKTFLNAEKALGENLVAQVMITLWTDENDDHVLWSVNGCARCGGVLADHTAGYVWARPLGNKANSPYCTLATFCSEECVSQEVQDWANELQKDVLIGYYSGVL